MTALAALEQTKAVLRAASTDSREAVRLSMVMIAKNEAANVRDCLASFWDHVDEVVLCDTGSTDGTIEVAEAFAAEHPGPDLIIGRFDWCDDFAAARNYADSLATGDWLLWCDLDDRTVGGEYLRGLAALAPAGLQGCRFLWSMGDAHPVGCDDQQETLGANHVRMVRNNGCSEWVGRCGEYRSVRGPTDYVCSRIAFWAHPKWEKIASPYYQQLWRTMATEDDSMAYWAWMYLTLGAFETHDFEQTVECASRFLTEAPFGNAYRPGIALRLVMALGQLQRAGDAVTAATAAHMETPRSQMACLAMVLAHGFTALPVEVVRWSNRLLDMGTPDRGWGDPFAPDFYVPFAKKMKAQALLEIA